MKNPTSPRAVAFSDKSDEFVRDDSWLSSAVSVASDFLCGDLELRRDDAGFFLLVASHISVVDMGSSYSVAARTPWSDVNNKPHMNAKVRRVAVMSVMGVVNPNESKCVIAWANPFGYFSIFSFGCDDVPSGFAANHCASYNMGHSQRLS